MCCNHKSVDLSLLEDVLAHYADIKGSLITILQKTQEIYGMILMRWMKADGGMWKILIHLSAKECSLLILSLNFR